MTAVKDYSKCLAAQSNSPVYLTLVATIFVALTKSLMDFLGESEIKKSVL